MLFKTPHILLLIPFVLSGIFYFSSRNKRPALRFPTFGILPAFSSLKLKLSILSYILRLGIIVLFFIAWAGPRELLEEVRIDAEGIDIVLAIDTSGSMAAEDFTLKGKRVNRLEIVKNVVRDFINKRLNDRIGLIAFSALAYTVSPLTTDYDWLMANLERVELGIIKDGTAIGSALAAGLTRLKDSEAKTRIIVLLTDGMNNSGRMDPLAAAEAARALGVKVYAIGVGTRGLAPYPARDVWGRKRYQQIQTDIDEPMLIKIAELTAGKYFRATDTEELSSIYNEIDSLEKSRVEHEGFRDYKELFGYFLMAALVLLFAEIFLSRTYLMRIP